MLLRLKCVNCGSIVPFRVNGVAAGPEAPVEGICNDCLIAYQEGGMDGILDRKYPNGVPPEVRAEDVLGEIRDVLLKTSL